MHPKMFFKQFRESGGSLLSPSARAKARRIKQRIMGFCLELKLLLWKNFTLKRRKPVMFIFELLIPLVLFVVLVLIRRRKPAIENPASYFTSWPLPSAGLIAVMQAFCESPPYLDEYGFPMYPNASVLGFLKNVNTVANNYRFFQPGFTLDELQEVPKIYKNILEDPFLIKQYFDSDTPVVKPADYLQDPKKLHDFMTKNLTFDPDLTHELIFNTTINKKNVFKMLFHNPNVTDIFHKKGNIEKDVAEAEDLQGEGVLYGYLRKHDISQEIYSILLGMPNATGNLLHHHVSSLLQRVILNDKVLSEYICNHNPDVQIWSCRGLVNEDSENCDSHFQKLSEKYCQLPHVQREIFISVISSQLDSGVINNLFKSWDKDEAQKRMETFRKHAETFIKFKLTVNDLFEVSNSMPHEYCDQNMTALGYDETTLSSGLAALDKPNNTEHTKKKTGGNPQPFVHIWKAMQKTICGADLQLDNQNFNTIEEIPMTDEQKSKLKLLIHVMYSNPKVLYVPTGTAADKIIEEANRTFVFIESVTNYASILANVSEELKTFLELGTSEYNFFIIMKIQKDMMNSAFSHFYFKDEIFRKFTEDPSISNRQVFVNQLEEIGIAACSWKTLMRGLSFNVFHGFQTEDEMQDYFKTKAFNDNVTVLAGVVFYMNDDGSLPNHMIYKIRQNATFVRDTQYVRSKFWLPGPGSDPTVYYQFGFVWMQDVFERAMINLYSGTHVIEPGTYINHMPYPCYVSDQFLFMIQHVMALCLTVSWVYSVAMLVQHIVYEKEQRLKEVMKMMGMRNSIHWIAWFISAFTQMTITVSILTIILKYGKVLAFSNPWIIFLTMEIFAVAIIMFSFLVSVLFSKAKIAAACAGILYFMSYVPYLYIAVREEGAHELVSLEAKMAASFLAPTALGLAARYFAFYEEIGQGMQWHNMAKTVSQYDTCHLAHILKMLLVDALIYAILFWYIESVHPGAFGIPKPWYFPFTKSYWLRTSHEPLSPSTKRHSFMSFMTRGPWWNSSHRAPIITTTQPPALHGQGGLTAEQSLGPGAGATEPEKDSKDVYEDEPEHLPMGVSITKLSKKYKNATKYAVHNLDLNLYEGQITCLLGPTGSGKTTIMSILTGLYPPTSGSAVIYGRDIGVHMDTIRSSLGLCPQHNVLFDDLTVDEHIWFYSRLKQGNNDVDTETEKLIVDLDLPHKRHQKVDCLSGGMKRRLSVAIAFVGGSRAVFVDEPTAGVDPVARRAIWDLILKYKKGRTILLSTHHMDEADILGDRIAIIENGQIKCCGSPLYLKHNLGDGYHLYIVKKTSESEFLSKCSQQSVTNFIRRRAPTVKFVKESKHELHYMLSLSDLNSGHFVHLFRDLEKFKENLHVQSYGVKNTTLEEIFMKVISERLDSESEIWNEESTEQINSGMAELDPESRKPSSCSALEEPYRAGSPSDVRFPNGNVLCRKDSEGNFEVSLFNLDEEGGAGDAGDEEESVDFIKDGLRNDQGLRDDPRLTPKYPVWQQFCAIIKKRYLCTKRNLEGLISQILLPSFFVSVAMSVALTAPDITDLPEMMMTTSQFHNITKPELNVMAIANNKLDLFEPKITSDASSDKILDTFKLPSGPGAMCVLKSPFLSQLERENKTTERSRTLFTFEEHYYGSMCKEVFQEGIWYTGEAYSGSIPFATVHPPFLQNFSSPSKERNYPICYCSEEKTGFVCPSYGYTDPHGFLTVTKDKIYDVSGQNESQYYLYTSDRFRLRRYGGISLGLTRSHVPINFGKASPSLFGKLAVRHAAKVWFDGNGYHSVPTYLNVMNNAILRANIPPGKGNPAGYGITVISHPWPNTHLMIMSTNRDVLQGNEVLISIFIIVAMSFVPASFALFVVYERYTRSSHLQLLSGVHPMTYLTANYIWDVCNYFVPASFIVAILLIFDVPAYSSRDNLPAVIILFLMYGWCISPVMHCASLIFNEPSSAYIFLIVINLFVGITCIVTSFLLEVFSSDLFIVQTHTMLRYLFLIFPNYCLGRGLMDIAFWHYYNIFLEKTGQLHIAQYPFDWNVTGRSLTAMICTGLSFFIINFLIESRRFSHTRQGKNFLQSLTLVDDTIDEDVLKERARVIRGLANEDILRVENLTKVYHTRKTGKHLAVDRLCFGVPSGECFGLLGVNSAGKSSTFKMLTGDTPITYGDAFINSYSVKTNSRIALKSIGYCPQIDALLDELTAREHLQLYARLRGVPSKEVDKVVDWALKKLDLLQYADRPCRTYSGGNRRKISTAIALIGSPSLIFLDEPTSGTDPRSRRFLWDLILSLVKEGRSIVFTSHSMEECEMLCTRLAIMVNGQFRCIGSTQHLKNKFGDGYSLTLRCNMEKDVGKIERYMKRVFSFAVLKEKHHSSLHYEIASQHVSLDDMFQKMEIAIKEMPILDYSVSQNTLDNVFINFVKNIYLSTSCGSATEGDQSFTKESKSSNSNDMTSQSQCASANP